MILCALLFVACDNDTDNMGSNRADYNNLDVLCDLGKSPSVVEYRT